MTRLLYPLLILALCSCYDWERDLEGTLGDPDNKRLLGSQIYDAITDAPTAVVFRDETRGTLIYDSESAEGERKVPFKITGDQLDIVNVEVNDGDHEIKIRKNDDGTASAKEIGSKVWVRYAKPSRHSIFR